MFHKVCSKPVSQALESECVLFVTYQIFPLDWHTLLPDTDVERSPLPAYVRGGGGEGEGDGGGGIGKKKVKEEKQKRERKREMGKERKRRRRKRNIF